MKFNQYFQFTFLIIAIVLLFNACRNTSTISKNNESLKVELKLIDSIKTLSPTVTIKTTKINNQHFIYTAGEGKILEINAVNSNRKFTAIGQHRINNKFGGIRGLTPTQIGNKNILIVGNKAENAVEIHQINKNGELQKINTTTDTDTTFLNQNITIELVKIGQKQFVFVGGLDTGLSSFELLNDGSLKHIHSILDNSTMFLNGIIGMTTLAIDSKTFVFTGGFIDGGVSSFRVFDDGRFENVDNVADNENLFLNGAFSLNSMQLKQQNFVMISHRHKVHYPFYAKEKGLVYHGDGVTVFRIDTQGKFTLSSLLKDTELLKLKGSTRIESIKINKQQAIVFIATRDEKSIQIAVLDDKGNLSALQAYDIPATVYNGMTIKKIGNQWFVFIGDYKRNMLYCYSVRIKNK